VLYLVGIALSPDPAHGTRHPAIVLRSSPLADDRHPGLLVVMVLSSLTRDGRIATFAWLAVWISARSPSAP